MWTQIVGKTLLARVPARNHWWHAALRVTSRGLASVPFPGEDGERSFDVELDLVDHLLTIRASDGQRAVLPLATRPVRDFYAEYVERLRALRIDARIWTTPVEVAEPIPFDRDDVHGEYDPAWAHRFWQVLRRCAAAFETLADGFVGKQSPVQFFWGSFDLASTRFSGRRAPERPGADRVTREAYSHEVISFGFWPGGTLPSGVRWDEPILYAYAAPTPDGFSAAAVRPPAARWDQNLGEFVLPYAAARAAADPAAELRAFCESVYDAGAALGRWDREALERHGEAPRDAGHGAPEGLHPR
jgi:hypothetical protein